MITGLDFLVLLYQDKRTKKTYSIWGGMSTDNQNNKCRKTVF